MAVLSGPYIDKGGIENTLGCVHRLVCTYMVKNVTGSSLSARMKVVFDLLDSYHLSFGYTSPSFPDLMISDVNLSPNPKDPNTWIAEIVYLNRGELEGIGVFSTSCSMTSATTYTDYHGFPITVEYTFPEEYPQDPDLAGLTIVQSAPVNVLLPTRELTATKLITTSNADALEANWIGCLNSTVWRGNTRGTVMCTNVSHKLMRLREDGEVGNKYLFQFSFQWLGRGHQPWVQFSINGETPPDLIRGVGYYQMNGIDKAGVSWYRYLDFSTIFPGS